MSAPPTALPYVYQKLLSDQEEASKRFHSPHSWAATAHHLSQKMKPTANMTITMRTAMIVHDFLTFLARSGGGQSMMMLPLIGHVCGVPLNAGRVRGLPDAHAKQPHCAREESIAQGVCVTPAVRLAATTTPP